MTRFFYYNSSNIHVDYSNLMIFSFALKQFINTMFFMKFLIFIFY
ncbi:hypothetical protein PCIT_a3669 [Pseudoalteromonas citrea]|uniref:Uncharacterized protein n=1 Tax=Pseudoalteromonas citrea TaxID=43655 RepID=A0AAD4AG19_9GAMM|nr:hypothetical protein PCIT_a3669 [Pseudoalteromonas citrea]